MLFATKICCWMPILTLSNNTHTCHSACSCVVDWCCTLQNSLQSCKQCKHLVIPMIYSLTVILLQSRAYSHLVLRESPMIRAYKGQRGAPWSGSHDAHFDGIMSFPLAADETKGPGAFVLHCTCVYSFCPLLLQSVGSPIWTCKRSRRRRCV